MRSSIILAVLPALAQASFFDNLQAKVNEAIGAIGNFKSVATAEAPVVAEEPVVEILNKKVLLPLSLPSWKETLFEPVEEDATTPEQWWVFITGGNKTCAGHCAHAEAVFNSTAAKFATMPTAPHTALLNCEEEPILCNAFSASPGAIWSFDMLPPPTPITIHARRLNLTSVSVDDLMALHDLGTEKWTILDGFLHPFDGALAQYNLQIPFAYVMWAFNLVPQWAFMMCISFATRFFMNRRMPGPNQTDGSSNGAAVAPATAAH